VGPRRRAGFRCAQQKVACAEVELVHAGNEHKQQQWRHAKPYVQIAEDLLGDAQQLAESCNPPPPPVLAPAPVAVPMPVPIPAPEPKAAPPALQEVVLNAAVLFNFDRHDAKSMRPFSVAQLEELVRRVQRDKLIVIRIQLSGHADRLNGTGAGDYNQRLSERRVATVKAELARLGLDAQVMRTAASGDSQQVTGCEARFPRPAELQECLLPNRRVEVVISARRP
jgi:OmpA-OmpF porin, OOP family